MNYIELSPMMQYFNVILYQYYVLYKPVAIIMNQTYICGTIIVFNKKNSSCSFFSYSLCFST